MKLGKRQIRWFWIMLNNTFTGIQRILAKFEIGLWGWFEFSPSKSG